MSAGITSTTVLAAFAAAHANDATIPAAPSPVTNPDGSSTYSGTSASAAIQLQATLFTEVEGSGKAGVWRVNLLATPVALDITSIKTFASTLGLPIGPNVQFTGMGVPGANGTVVSFSQGF